MKKVRKGVEKKFDMVKVLQKLNLTASQIGGIVETSTATVQRMEKFDTLDEYRMYCNRTNLRQKMKRERELMNQVQPPTEVDEIEQPLPVIKPEMDDLAKLLDTHSQTVIASLNGVIALLRSIEFNTRKKGLFNN
jgi:hypothetical protein